MSVTKNHNITCGRCGESYSRPNKSLEEKKDFPNCPNCSEPGNIYHPIEYQFKKKSLTALEMLKLALED